MGSCHKKGYYCISTFVYYLSALELLSNQMYSHLHLFISRDILWYQNNKIIWIYSTGNYILYLAITYNGKESIYIIYAIYYTNNIIYYYIGASTMTQRVKNPPSRQKTQEMRVWSLGWEDTLEKEMTTPHPPSILAWEIPWIEKPGGLVRKVTKNWTWLSN